MEPLKEQEQLMYETRKKLDKAQAEYQQAMDAYHPFMLPERDRILESAPNLMRAAYSDRMAWIMAVMAKLAYIEFEAGKEQYDFLAKKLAEGKFELVKTFSEGSTQAFLARNDFFAVLAFRGTEPTKLEDVRSDIRAYKKSTAAGRVHAGFLDAYNQVADEIMQTLIDENQNKWPLYITGHSLGGALATVATHELDTKQHIGDQIAACYTFGSPRVGNRTYEGTVKVPVYRIVHSTDIVTLVPNIGYTHIGDPRFISRNGNFYRKIPFFRRGFEMLLALLPFGWSRWVASHDMSTYRDKLKKIAIERNLPSKTAPQ